MEYKSFQSLVKFLDERNFIIDKESLQKLLTIESFGFNIKDALEIILPQNSLKEEDKIKFLDMLVNIGNDSLLPFDFVQILKNPYIRENDYYINTIMNEPDSNRRKNLIRALKNEEVANDLNLFNLILRQIDSQIQRRIVAVLEFEVGIFNVDKIQSANSDNIEEVIKELEKAVVKAAISALETLTKTFVDNPTQENRILLRENQVRLDRVLTHYEKTELSMELPEVSGEGTKALIFKPKNVN